MKSPSEKLVDVLMAMVDTHVKSVFAQDIAGQVGLYSVTLRTLLTMLVKERDVAVRENKKVARELERMEHKLRMARKEIDAYRWGRKVSGHG